MSQKNSPLPEKEVIWVGKPFLKKTIIKFLILGFPFLYFAGLLIPFFLFYLYYKRSFTYYVTRKTIRITQDWFFGHNEREFTFDQIKDVHIQQGIIARKYNCGDLIFTTTTGLEVGYVFDKKRAVPATVKTYITIFKDVPDPIRVRKLIIDQMVEWREVVQQQKIAKAVEKIAEKI